MTRFALDFLDLTLSNRRVPASRILNPAFFFSLFLTLLLGCSLFFIKERIQEEERALTQTKRDLKVAQNHLNVLKAEWEFLNAHTRLRVLAEEHLGLKPFSTHQYALLAEFQESGPNQRQLASATLIQNGPKHS